MFEDAAAGSSTPAPHEAGADADRASSAPVASEAAAAPDTPRPRPEGEPGGVTRLREMIEAKLTEMGGAFSADQEGRYVLGLESARIFVIPSWLDGGVTVVRVFAITNLDVPVTAELTSWLLEKNLEFVFGAFAFDRRAGAVWFNHNLLGDFADPEELETAIAAVAQTAARFDDEIRDRFGGRLYVDAPGTSVAPPSAPGYL